MTNFIFANNVDTSLAGSLSSTSTTLTLASTTGLPSSIPSGSSLVITLRDRATRQITEIIYATSISGATLSGLQRGQEGTTALNWLVGDYAYSGPTAAQMGQFLQAPSTHGILLAVQVFPNAGTFTYNPTSGATYGIVDVVAAGAGGGYAATSNIGSGGGGGGFARAFINALASQSIVVGSGGLGGTSTVAATDGGNSSFGASISASGGKAGGSNSNAGGAPGIGLGGNINLSGSSGAGGIIQGSLFLGGFGGTTPGYSTTAGYIQSGSGLPPTGPGGGGGGGSNGGNGANGYKGMVIVWEFT